MRNLSRNCYGKYATWRKQCDKCPDYSYCWRETNLKKAGIYVPREQLDRKAHCWLEKDFIFSGEFGELLSAARSIFWPICTFWNRRKKVAFPSIQTLSIMSGVSEQTVNKGLKDLAKKMPYGFTISKDKRHNVYGMDLPYRKPKESPGTCFKVHSFPVQSGIYRRLKPNAKALSLGLKAYGRFDFDAYVEMEELDLSIDEENNFWDRDGMFANRKYDFITFDHSISRQQIAYNIGIAPERFAITLEELEAAGSIESVKHRKGFYKIFRTTKDDKIPSRLRLLNEICEMTIKKG